MIESYDPSVALPEAVPWTVHGRRPLYASEWVSLDLVAVEPPGVGRYEHHLVVVPRESVGVVVHSERHGVLMLYRHRFATGTVGFEIPAGAIDDGESAVDAAAREVREETGWEVDPPEVFLSCNASDGMSDQRFHFAYARARRDLGPPVDAHEATRLYWVPLAEVSALIRGGGVPGGPTMLALLYATTFGYLPAPP